MSFADQLFKDVWEEAFRQSPLGSREIIADQRFFTTSTFHIFVARKNIFDLYQPPEREGANKTRPGKIYDALMQLPEFRSAMSDSLPSILTYI